MPSQPEMTMKDKHGLLSAPLDSLLMKMTVPMVFGMVAILMFNLVDTFFISMLGTKPWLPSVLLFR